MSRFVRIVGPRFASTITTTIVLSTLAGALPQKSRANTSGPSPSVDVTRVIDFSPKNKLVFPYGVQSFENRENVDIGDSVLRLPGWDIEGAGTVSAFVAENSGLTRPGTDSKRWLCVEDFGATGVQGMSSPLISAPEPWNYSWSFSLQIQDAPASGIDTPVIAIQHRVGSGFADAWGVRLTPLGAELFMTDAFGEPAAAPLFVFGAGAELGQWIDVRVVASLSRDTLRAYVNGVETAMMRVRTAETTDVTRQRFSYHGSGSGNFATIMLDDVGVAFLGAVCEENLLVDFTNEDDGATPLANGQDIDAANEFGAKLTISGSGPNAGAAIFDSSLAGPNDPSQDMDLLVGQGNILILQTDENPGPVAGVFPLPNDDEDGGTLSFAFNRPLQPLSIDVIDIDDGIGESASIVMTDFSGNTRTYTIPADWTGNGGVGTLDLQSLAAQAGFNSVATVAEDAGFDANAVVSMTVELGSSGALDNLNLVIPCVQMTFETEDDFTPVFTGTPLANGQDLSTPPEFGVEMTLSSAGPNSGAAIFDSTPGGPNDPGPDNDLLVGLGNILILQNDLASTQSVGGFFDVPNDDTNGGSLFFTFPGEVECHRIDLIDIDEEEVTGATVTLLDSGGKTRTFTAPPSWTEDRLNDGPPAFRTLDLSTLAPQPGFLAVATAVEDAGFDPTKVIMMTVTFGGAQAMDNFCFCP